MKLYLIAASHLDTTWEWTLETTVEKFLPLTFSENFALLDKYPHFKFGWEGAYRYELLEEYYPELFAKLKKYIKKGKWAPVGSAYENGDVNQPSPEALFRNIIYGQNYFREKFGVTSNDIFLPDCFGFGWALPSIAVHAGLKGFISQKLSYGSAYGYPFDLGLWYGSDGNYILTSLRPGSYSLAIENLGELRECPEILEKFKTNEQYGLEFTNRFFGTGDKGMGVKESTAAFIEDQISKNADSDIEIECVTSPEFFEIFDELDDDIKKRLPVWKTELPLSSHGVGGYTSRTPSSRWNKAAERLADDCERASVYAMLLGGEYPQTAIDKAWKRVIAHQFHDDITGTSLMKCYMRNWNDYLMSLDNFKEEYRNSIETVISGMDFSFAEGLPVAVFDPMIKAGKTKRVVSVDTGFISSFAVYDRTGREVPSQTDTIDGLSKVTFIAETPSLGAAAYDIRLNERSRLNKIFVSASLGKLENEFLVVRVDENGDVCSVVEKETGEETLASPIRHALFDYKGHEGYPAWELTYDELCRQPADYAIAEKIELLQAGPVRASLRITKKVRGSTVTEILTLDAGSRRIDWQCETDWREEQALLKVVFSGKASNRYATYDLGLGVIRREINSPRVFECAAQTWADITDESEKFGFSVFSDSKTGWDKPDGSTLRLTVVHTPLYAKNPGQAHNLLDLGLNRYGFSYMPHFGGWQNCTQSESDIYLHPARTLIVKPKKGSVGERSLASIAPGIIVRCFKKEQNGDRIVLRVNEANGDPRNRVGFTLDGGIAEAYEANAVEERIGDARIKYGKLLFDLKPFEVKTFVITPAEKKRRAKKAQKQIDLPYDIKAITKPGEPGDLDFNIPAVLIGKKVNCGGVDFRISDEDKNAMVCRGQTIELADGYDTAYMLFASLGKDKQYALAEPYGSWDMIGLAHTGEIVGKILAFHATHAHDKDGNVIPLRDLCLYKSEFPIVRTGGGKHLHVLPDDPDTLVIAVTLAKHPGGAVFVEKITDTLEKRACDYRISYEAFKRLREGREPDPGNVHVDPDGNKFVDVADLMLDNGIYDLGRAALDD